MPRYEKKYLSLGIFSAGSLALLAAGTIALGRFSDTGPAAAFFVPAGPIDVGAEPRVKRDFTGNPVVQTLKGLWVAELRTGRASLQISRDRFQMIFVPFSGPEKGYRLFSHGDLEVVEKNLILVADNETQPPAGTDPALKRFYRPLTGRAFAIALEMPAPDSMIWRKGPGTYDGVHGVPSFHPLFNQANIAPDQAIVWKRMPAPEKQKADAPAQAPDAGTP